MGDWGSPQQAKIGQFSRWRKLPDLPKGYHTALLAATMSLTLKGRGKTALLRGSYPSYNIKQSFIGGLPMSKIEYTHRN